MAGTSTVTELVRQRIKEALDEQGLSQNEFARRSGLASPSITKIMKGGDIMLNTLSRFAEGMNTTPADLVRVDAGGETRGPKSKPRRTR